MLIRHDRPTFLPCLAAGLLPLASCIVDTSYTPRHPRRATLVMHQNQLHIFVAGTRQDLASFAGTMRCDADAAADADQAERYTRSARTNAAIAAPFIALSGLIPAFAFIALPFAIIADNSQNRAGAAAVNAINRYNDAVACMKEASR